MGNPKGFIEVERKKAGYRPVEERVDDFSEVEQILNKPDRKLQASRCMDCGVPFCHWGCPLGNVIPEWQDSLYRGNITEAINRLHSTNNLPEITGRVCPAPCETSCVLAIHEEPVTIRENECAIVDQAFKIGAFQPNPPSERSGKKVAVIGSGPAGMSAADQLNKAGHLVTVYERDDFPGGLMRYGIPDFKLSKRVIERRVKFFEEEGITFVCNTEIGKDISGKKVLTDFDAVVLATGSTVPRDLPAEGRDLDGVHFAMDFLKQQNKIVNEQDIAKADRISAKKKNVLVIGGGDTGSDCVGTSNRQKAASVKQIEIMPKPSDKRGDDNPWPYWPNTLRTSTSHEEGCERDWSLATKRFIGENGKLKQVEVVTVEWKQVDGRMQMEEVKGSEKIIETELALLSMGFVHTQHEGLVKELGLELDGRGNVVAKEGQTNNDKVFVAGDATTGASLIVRAIASARATAEAVDGFLND